MQPARNGLCATLGTYDEQPQLRNDYTKEIEVSRLKPIYTLAFASVLAGVMSGCADFREGRGPSATPDAKITADVRAQLDLMADLGPPGSIRVQTFDNVV